MITTPSFYAETASFICVKISDMNMYFHLAVSSCFKSRKKVSFVVSV